MYVNTWDAMLPYVAFVYNTAMQETTQVTPYKLVYGRSPAPMFDAVLPLVTDEADLSVASYLQRTEKA